MLIFPKSLVGLKPNRVQNVLWKGENSGKVRTHALAVSGVVRSSGYQLILIKYSCCKGCLHTQVSGCVTPQHTHTHTLPLSKYSDDSSRASSSQVKQLNMYVKVFQQQAVAYLFLSVY